MAEVERSAKLLRKPDAKGRWGCFRVRQGDRSWLYLFREIDCDIGGRGWEIRRLAAGFSYFTRTGHTGNMIGCDCIGYEARGLCRHVLAMTALIPKIDEAS